MLTLTLLLLLLLLEVLSGHHPHLPTSQSSRTGVHFTLRSLCLYKQAIAPICRRDDMRRRRLRSAANQCGGFNFQLGVCLRLVFYSYRSHKMHRCELGACDRQTDRPTE